MAGAAAAGRGGGLWAAGLAGLGGAAYCGSRLWQEQRAHGALVERDDDGRMLRRQLSARSVKAPGHSLRNDRLADSARRRRSGHDVTPYSTEQRLGLLAALAATNPGAAYIAGGGTSQCRSRYCRSAAPPSRTLVDFST